MPGAGPALPAMLSAPLAVLVLLPDALSSNTPGRAQIAPPSLVSRNSGSSVPRMSGLTTFSMSAGDQDDQASDPLIVQSRRLSLAPHLGTGQSKPLSPYRTASPTSTSPGTTPLNAVASERAGGPSSFRRTGVASRKSSIPEHLVSSPSLQKPRASVAYPSGAGLLPAGGRRRANSEGDELVDLFRTHGVEVAVIRHLTHLPNVIAHPKAPSTSLSTPGATSNVQQVVLVPLGDAPPLPSLSLFLAQGTTPTAVCFQQDLLDRARKIEETFLADALERIAKVRSAVEKELGSGSGDHPVIIGYLAHGSLSQGAISECLDAGASGILHPPYDSRAVAQLKILVGAANEGTTATVALQGTPTTNSLQSSPIVEEDAKVVLTPTALSLGAEHESEKVLSASYHSQRRRSTQISLNRITSSSSTGSGGLRGLSSELTQEAQPKTPHTALGDFSFPTHLNNLLSASTHDDTTRRRSVDTGGLALAFDRASKHMETIEQTGESDGASEKFNPVAGDVEQEIANGSSTTEFAEVLGEMYNQTMMSIEVQMGDYDEMAAPLSREDHQRLVDAVSEWAFRPHQLDSIDLFRVACLIFQSVLNMDGVAQLGLDYEATKKWLFAVRAIYHAPNPYHNYIHAIDVLQATYQFLVRIGVAPPFSWLRDLEPGKTAPWKRSSQEEQPSAGRGSARAREILRPQDVLAVVIAAMGHDVGHPGLSNAFMKNAKVPLSVVYDDKSVLENMHCMLSVQLLRKHGFGFLLASPTASEAEEYPARAKLDSRGFRRVLYSAILATDMSLHFAWIQRLKELGEAVRGEKPLERDDLVEEDRIMMCQALIKCADISNPSRPMDISEHWSAVLLDEWGKQASLEQELELPVSVAVGVDARLQAKGQIGFIDLFTAPLFQAAAEVLPELEEFADSVMSNRSVWKGRLEKLEADEAANEMFTTALRAIVSTPLPVAEDDRYTSLFPLILPSKLVAHSTGSDSPAASPPASPARHSGNAPPSPIAHAAHAHAVRAVYRDEVKERSMLEKHLLALTGFDPASHGRRMSTPDALLVRRKP